MESLMPPSWRPDDSASNDLFRAMSEQAAVGIAMADLEGRLVYANTAYCLVVGRVREDVVGRTIAELTDPEDWPRNAPLMSRAIAGGEPFTIEKRYHRPDGSAIWVRNTVNAYRDVGGTVVGTMAVVVDVTERVLMQRAVRQSEQLMRRVLDNLLAFVALLTPDGALLEVNRAPLEFGGVAAAEVIGRDFWDCHWWSYAPDVQAQIRDDVGRAGRGDVVRHDVPARIAGDGRMWIDFQVAPLRDDDDRITHLIVSGMDLTARRQAEDALQDADRRKDEFIAILAHELRNPMAPIQNALQILRLSKGDARVQAQAHSMIERQVGQLGRLIDDLLDVSRINSGKITLDRRPVDVVLVIRQAIETMAPAMTLARQRLVQSMPDQPLHVDGDVVRLVQIVTNLLSNAMKYGTRGSEVRISATSEDGFAVVRVADDGIGLSADTIPKLFTLFMQVDTRPLSRTQGGLGVGLALVKRLVTLHGGRVEARSAGIGQGSEFTVRLPLIPEPVVDTGAGVDGTDAAAPPRCRAVVVDDNYDAARSLATLLAMMGVDTRVAYDGATALGVIEAHRPELVVLDIGMPEMNGYELAGRIRAQPWGQSATLVALTGWGQDEDRRRAHAAGFDVHLVKPARMEQLQRILDGLQQGPAPG
jgi:PAS domain S-box-containing protein